ncbi:hypothetical protein LEMLEM_LOCUS2007 [Lemmus lemmus]
MVDYYEVLGMQRHAHLRTLKRRIGNRHLNGIRTKILKIKKQSRNLSK